MSLTVRTILLAVVSAGIAGCATTSTPTPPAATPASAVAGTPPPASATATPAAATPAAATPTTPVEAVQALDRGRVTTGTGHYALESQSGSFAVVSVSYQPDGAPEGTGYVVVLKQIDSRWLPVWSGTTCPDGGGLFPVFGVPSGLVLFPTHIPSACN